MRKPRSQMTTEEIFEDIRERVNDARYGYGACNNQQYYIDVTFLLEQLSKAGGLKPELTDVLVLQKEIAQINIEMAAEKKSHLETLNQRNLLKKTNEVLERSIKAYRSAYEKEHAGLTLDSAEKYGPGDA